MSLLASQTRNDGDPGLVHDSADGPHLLSGRIDRAFYEAGEIGAVVDERLEIGEGGGDLIGRAFLARQLIQGGSVSSRDAGKRICVLSHLGRLSNFRNRSRTRPGGKDAPGGTKELQTTDAVGTRNREQKAPVPRQRPRNTGDFSAQPCRPAMSPLRRGR